MDAVPVHVLPFNPLRDSMSMCRSQSPLLLNLRMVYGMVWGDVGVACSTMNHFIFPLQLRLIE